MYQVVAKHMAKKPATKEAMEKATSDLDAFLKAATADANKSTG